MKHQKPMIRRTFLEERFEILIKKQKKGNATFAELTELDEIVNSNNAIRYSILEEMEGIDNTGDDTENKDVIFTVPKKTRGLTERIKDLISRLLTCTTWFYTMRISLVRMRILY